MESDYLTEKGQQYASYILRGHLFLSKVPWVGKYGVAILMSIVYQIILKEGAKYNAGRTETEVS